MAETGRWLALGLGVFFLVCSVVFSVRNIVVYRYLMGLLALMHEMAMEDIEHGRPWRWRYEEFESVRQWDMVLLAFTPLESFYPDKSFIRPGAPKPGSRDESA